MRCKNGCPRGIWRITSATPAAHADALVEYFGVSKFWIAGFTHAGAESFATALEQRHEGLSVQALAAGSLKQEVPETDVIIALTTSTVLMIPTKISPKTLAIGVCAFKPSMAEFSSELLHAGQIIVDDLDGAKHEAGDLIQANIDWPAVVRLADILLGKVPHPTAIPVFKTIGQAAWDLAVARVTIRGSKLKPNFFLTMGI